MIQFFFPIGLFLGAWLLFIIQPMVAKVLLPIYGGTPAVWTVCMLFFQILLLVAYGYAWVLSRFRSKFTWRLAHTGLCLLSISMLPLNLVPTPSNGAPELQILLHLVMQLGLPLLVVGSSAPLLQYAYSQTSNKHAADPYFLYAASNSGSLLALLCYPWLVERFTGIRTQFYDWNILYAGYLLVLLSLLFFARYNPNIQATKQAIPLSLQKRAHWVFLSFIPCSMMLGVTFYISSDVASTPLFWVIPLALYLLSFVLTFASKPLVSHSWVRQNTLLFLIFPILCFIIGPTYLFVMLSAHWLAFFIVALLCHGELVRIRPPVERLTNFYFCMALGGVLAGLFNSILAPRLFAHAYEYPLVMLMVLLCIPIPQNKHYISLRFYKKWFVPCIVVSLLLCNYCFQSSEWGKHLANNHIITIAAFSIIMVWPGSPKRLFLSMAILFLFIFAPWFNPAQVLTQQRNFYGIKQVLSKNNSHFLMSQSTVHGMQFSIDKKPTNGAIAYYNVTLPIIQQLQKEYQPLRAMVIGLGTGIMACQFQQHDQLTIIEIDEQVIGIANNPLLFTYLRDCPPHATLIKDDGLLAATRADDSSYELLVMDAFQSDAIPIHLLTKEAFTIYKNKITPNGIILVHISNRHLQLLPVLTGVAKALDMNILYKLNKTNLPLMQFASEWALLTPNHRFANRLVKTLGWSFVTDNKTQLWSNDYSNIIPLMKW